MYSNGQEVTIFFSIDGRLVSSPIIFQGRTWKDSDGTEYGCWKNDNNGNFYWFTSNTVSTMQMNDDDIETVESYG